MSPLLVTLLVFVPVTGMAFLFALFVASKKKAEHLPIETASLDRTDNCAEPATTRKRKRSLFPVVSTVAAAATVVVATWAYSVYENWRINSPLWESQENIRKMKIEGDARIRKIERLSNAQMQKHPALKRYGDVALGMTSDATLNQMIEALDLYGPRYRMSDYLGLREGTDYLSILLMWGQGDELSSAGLVKVCQWRNEDGSNITATFHDWKLISKAQFGLR